MFLFESFVSFGFVGWVGSGELGRVLCFLRDLSFLGKVVWVGSLIFWVLFFFEVRFEVFMCGSYL